MSRIVIAPIVEGHGEVQAVPVLLRRLWDEVIRGEFVDVLRPVRCPRTKMVRRAAGSSQSLVAVDECVRAVTLAARKLAERTSQDPKVVLVLLDADSDCPAHLGPELSEAARRAPHAFPVECVLARVEFETWFVAAARSLARFVTLGPDDPPPDPEQARAGKKWIAERFHRPRYSETVDQPRLTAEMNLEECRRASPSFDTLCRRLAKHAGSRSP